MTPYETLQLEYYRLSAKADYHGMESKLNQIIDVCEDEAALETWKGRLANVRTNTKPSWFEQRKALKRQDVLA